VSRDDASVRFRVEDTGVGIAPDQIPHLFDRFWQAHESGRAGAGLGLVIAHGIAGGHGGWIEVDSQPGRGSVFTLVLPAQP
jgi:signal transduction histidine kinase